MLRCKVTPLQMQALHNSHRKNPRRVAFHTLGALKFPQKHPKIPRNRPKKGLFRQNNKQNRSKNSQKAQKRDPLFTLFGALLGPLFWKYLPKRAPPPILFSVKTKCTIFPKCFTTAHFVIFCCKFHTNFVEKRPPRPRGSESVKLLFLSKNPSKTAKSEILP